mmetsp:Transcript_343/g.703  ORF Transcript_343/g.703 Transcript_343/m.703 type:complete len:297 (-) Transcript_343:8-898(-)
MAIPSCSIIASSSSSSSKLPYNSSMECLLLPDSELLALRPILLFRRPRPLLVRYSSSSSSMDKSHSSSCSFPFPSTLFLLLVPFPIPRSLRFRRSSASFSLRRAISRFRCSCSLFLRPISSSMLVLVSMKFRIFVPSSYSSSLVSNLWSRSWYEASAIDESCFRAACVVADDRRREVLFSAVRAHGSSPRPAPRRVGEGTTEATEDGDDLRLCAVVVWWWFVVALVVGEKEGGVTNTKDSPCSIVFMPCSVAMQTSRAVVQQISPLRCQQRRWRFMPIALLRCCCCRRCCCCCCCC